MTTSQQPISAMQNPQSTLPCGYGEEPSVQLFKTVPPRSNGAVDDSQVRCRVFGGDMFIGRLNGLRGIAIYARSQPTFDKVCASSVIEQVRHCKKLIGELGGTTDDSLVFWDAGVQSVGEGASYAVLLDAIAGGLITAIVVVSADRLALDCERLRRLLHSHSVSVLTVDGVDTGTEHGGVLRGKTGVGLYVRSTSDSLKGSEPCVQVTRCQDFVADLGGEVDPTLIFGDVGSEDVHQAFDTLLIAVRIGTVRCLIIECRDLLDDAEERVLSQLLRTHKVALLFCDATRESVPLIADGGRQARLSSQAITMRPGPCKALPIHNLRGRGGVAIYASYSQRSYQRLTVGDQITSCQSFIASLGGARDEAMVFSDAEPIVGGARCGYRALIMSIEVGSVQWVVTQEDEPLGRDDAEAASFRALLREHGATLLICDDDDDLVTADADIEALRLVANEVMS